MVWELGGQYSLRCWNIFTLRRGHFHLATSNWKTNKIQRQCVPMNSTGLEYMKRVGHTFSIGKQADRARVTQVPILKVAVPTWPNVINYSAIVNNDHKNNLMKFEKDSPFYLWVLQWWSWFSGPLISMVISILLKTEMVKFLKNLHIGLTAKKLFFQIKN